MKKVIIVGADMMSSITDYTDRKTCILFGDGGGAVLLEASDDEDGLIDANLKANPEGGKYLYKKAGGSLNPASVANVLAKEHFLFQDGRPVFKYAVNGMSTAINELLYSVEYFVRTFVKRISSIGGTEYCCRLVWKIWLL